MPRLLVSVKDVDEVEDAIAGGADIIDVKDPTDGSLGLPNLCIARDVVSAVKSMSSKEVSMALGDVVKDAKALSYIAFVGGVLGVDYVKIGIACNNLETATKIARDVIDVLSPFSRTKLILVGYADFTYAGTLEPLNIVNIAARTGAKGVMIDTLRKNGASTFDLLPVSYLKAFVREAHNESLVAAVAGGIKLVHLPLCTGLGFDVVGVRGAVCSSKRSGRISKELVSLFRAELDKLVRR